MKSLLASAKSSQVVLYDANCLAYFCMHSELEDGGRRLVVVYPELTELTRQVTDFLILRGVKIATLRVTYDELSREKAAQIVRDLISHATVRRQLGLGRAEAFPPLLELRLLKSLDKKLRGLQGREWFEIRDLTAANDDLAKVRQFFTNLRADPRMVELMKKKHRNHPCPSLVDMTLLIASARQSAPLLTNDSDLTTFADELRKARLCHQVFALTELHGES